MSRVVRFSTLGGPEVLKIEEVDVRLPGPSEVRISVKALGLNRAETLWRRGMYIEPATLPAQIGFEASGVIESVGEGVNSIEIGDAVSVIPGFSMNEYGTCGELIVVPAKMVIKTPPFLSYLEAASIWMMFLTAYDAIIDPVRPSVGTTVLIPDASSAEGIAAIQITNAIGAIPVALTRSKKQRQKLLGAGAAYVVVTEHDDWISRFQHARSGSGSKAPVVFDPFFGPMKPSLLESLDARQQGLSDFLSPRRIPEAFARLPTIFGYPMWGLTSDAARLRTATKFILAGFKSCTFKPVIDMIFPFEEIVEAHHWLEANQHFGKIIVTL